MYVLKTRAFLQHTINCNCNFLPHRGELWESFEIPVSCFIATNTYLNGLQRTFSLQFLARARSDCRIILRDARTSVILVNTYIKMVILCTIAADKYVYARNTTTMRSWALTRLRI